MSDDASSEKRRQALQVGAAVAFIIVVTAGLFFLTQRDAVLFRHAEQAYSRGDYADAARLANCAAGIVVGKFGPATVSAEELRG